MTDRDRHLNRLKLAEQQFRLACTVHLAVANGVQTLDVPVEWSFGRHRVSYEDFGLRADQADYAALNLEMAATFIITGVVRDALVALFGDPKVHQNSDVVTAYQISRLIRNAFAHSMLYPCWSIDEDCRDRTFSIADVISLNTTGLQGKALDWRDYGGPLAIFYFGRFVREVLLGDKIDPNRKKASVSDRRMLSAGSVDSPSCRWIACRPGGDCAGWACGEARLRRWSSTARIGEREAFEAVKRLAETVHSRSGSLTPAKVHTDSPHLISNLRPALP